MLIGRTYERARLEEAYGSGRAEFVAVYGRRRIGKTFLVRETFGKRFFFKHTGKSGMSSGEQLDAFRKSLLSYGLKGCPPLRCWADAFEMLKKLIASSRVRRKVIFIDELPWMDTPRSKFVPEFEYFWNDWASARPDVMLIVCGSATSWIIGKIVRNKGGLHNRLTMQLALQPFTLGECEQYATSQGLDFSRRDLGELYMVFGGVPYYWSLLRKGNSVARSIDSLFFAPGGELSLEFDQLYSSLYNNPEPYLAVIEALGSRRTGLTRDELLSMAKLPSSGNSTRVLNDLEQCGFIRRYQMFGNRSKGMIYQLMDAFTLFVLQFVRNNRDADPHFWSSAFGTSVHNVWAGLAFERLCLSHVDQIKHALGISGVKTSAAAWRHVPDEEHTSGAQVDLLIDRADNVINLCEMKYAASAYELNAKHEDELRERRATFLAVTGTNKTVMTTIVTSVGLKRNKYCGAVQSEIVLNDFFSEIRDPRL